MGVVFSSIRAAKARSGFNQQHVDVGFCQPGRDQGAGDAGAYDNHIGGKRFGHGLSRSAAATRNRERRGNDPVVLRSPLPAT